MGGWRKQSSSEDDDGRLKGEPKEWEKSLAHLVAGLIVGLFQVLRAIFQAVFSILSSLV